MNRAYVIIDDAVVRRDDDRKNAQNELNHFFCAYAL